MLNRIERHDITNAAALALVLMLCVFVILRWVDAVGNSWSNGLWEAEAAESIPEPTPAALKAAEEVRGQHARNEVTVLVGNGTLVSGLASDGTSMMTDNGYGSLTPQNVDGDPVPRSTVYYGLGFRPDAEAIAILMSIDSEQVVTLTDGIGLSTDGADVVVVLGQDLGN